MVDCSGFADSLKWFEGFVREKVMIVRVVEVAALLLSNLVRSCELRPDSNGM